MLRKILRGERDTQRKAHSSWYGEGIFDNLQPHFTMRKVCLFICTHLLLLHVTEREVDGVVIQKSKIFSRGIQSDVRGMCAHDTHTASQPTAAVQKGQKGTD